MFTLVGLEPWEVVALSALSAWGMLVVSSTIGFTLAWLVCRERAPAPQTAPAKAAAARPESVGYAPATA